jgi:hypothetical protein
VNEETPVKPEQELGQNSSYEQEQTRQEQVDVNLDQNEDAETLLEQSTSEKQHLADETLRQQEGSIPDSLWLSALSPAPMGALVVGLPGTVVAAESCEGGAEAPE